MKATKKGRPLPTRGGLNDLAKTQRSINDYAKASPVNNSSVPSTTLVQNLRNPRASR